VGGGGECRGVAGEAGQGGVRGEVEELAAGAFGFGQETRVGPDGGLDHFVAGQAGLDQEAPAGGARPDEAGGPHQQPEGLLAGPESGGEQFGVEVEEDDRRRRALWVWFDPVEDGLGSDEDGLGR
jgi:hypothetical protein